MTKKVHAGYFIALNVGTRKVSFVTSICCWLLCLLQPVFVMAQQPTGKVAGIIRDESNNPIASATITVEKEKRATSSSVSGDYVLTLPVGTYTLVVTAIGYETRRITEVQVKAGEQFDLSVSMKSGKSTTLGGIVVSSTAKKESTRSLLQTQKNNSSMTDGISAELIAKLPDVNTAQVLKRVSGITVQNDKFVTIRGVSDRYNNVLINGSGLPSTEPNRRNFSFDIVPSPLIDNVVVNKTATPDLSGEFTGGIVQVQTKDIPTKNFFDIAVGTGINTASINQEYQSLKRDKNAAAAGIDKEKFWYGPGKAFEQEVYIKQLLANNQDYMKNVAVQIPNRWQFYNYNYTPVQNYQLAGGRAKRFENGNSLGVVAAVTYLNEMTFEEGEARSLQNFDSKSKRSKYSTTIGGILNAGYKTKQHKFAWKNLYNKKYSNQFDEKEGYNINFTSPELRQSDVTIAARMFQTRLEGEHLLTERKIKVDWFGDFVRLDRDQPDSRFLLSTTPLGYNYNLNDRNINYGGLFSSILEETRKNVGVNLSFPFQFQEQKQLVKVGYSYSRRNANYEATSLRILASDITQIPEAGYIPYYTLAQQSNFQNGNLYYIPTYANSASTGDKYQGIQDLTAFYGMIDFKLFEKLRITGGVRNEFNKMQVSTVFYEQVGNPPQLAVVDSTKEYRERDWLPSFNLIYSVNSKINIRGAFSKTLARPDFIERSPYLYFDFPEQLAVIGSGALEMTRINNYDLRFEYYPTGAEIFSFSLFLKDFENPVERFFIIGNPSNSVEYRNLKSAVARGFEVDIRKNLSFIDDGAGIWKNFTVNGNFSMLDGEISYLITKSPTTGQDTIPYTAGDKRPIQGLAPYIINAGVGYQEKNWGATVALNRSGRKIVNGGTFSNIIQYENPRTLLDFQVNAKLLKQRMELRLNIADILNQDYIIYSNNINQDTNGSYPTDSPNDDPKGDAFNADKDFINYKVKKGTNIYLNLIYKF